ncbi:probable mitochondrial ribonuclease P catalytic subunit at C-terminar half [Coccomyxa sp. Obi]|nr:probable mitochondrial ribonuclease P catalytic subunit at C-terminar half [Coccomyxa sp. Obi]
MVRIATNLVVHRLELAGQSRSWRLTSIPGSLPPVRNSLGNATNVRQLSIFAAMEEEKGTLQCLSGFKGQGRKGTPSPTLVAERRTPSPKPLQQPTVQQQPTKRAMVGQQQPRKKGRKMTPEGGVRAEIFQAAKENDPLGGLAVYDRAVAEGISMGNDLFETLLYLCSGGQAWDAKLPAAGQIDAGSGHDEEARKATNKEASTSGQEMTDSNSAPQEGTQHQAVNKAEHLTSEEWVRIAERGKQLLQMLRDRGAGKSEVCYTAAARMAATEGKPDEALAAARDALSAGLHLKLRSFVPALKAHCAAGNVDAAFEVDELIAAQQLDLTEDEYALLIGVCAHGATWERAEGVLRRMARELTTLQEGTLAAVETYFRSPSAARALEEGQTWVLDRCTVSESGQPSCCDGHLEAVDLSPEEYHAFAEGIASLARQKEKRPSDFDTFRAWLDQNGPFGYVIDGANVALFGQNWEAGGFSFAQIAAVLDQMHEKRPGLKPLLMLHQSRVKAVPARQRRAASLLERLRRENSFYATPFGSNDDWYWLYAAVKSGPDALMVSCDEMRDHLFQLLAPKYFKKWKQRHQVYYRFTASGEAVLTHPAPFTVCTQHLKASNAWMFPSADSDQWLCARPQ